MSTATGRPVGDNEFPVLLRLPDLNAPMWTPLSATSLAPAVMPAMETSLGSLRTDAAAYSAQAPLATVATTANAGAAAPLPPTTTVEMVAATPTVEMPRAASTSRAERSARIDRSPNPGQWTLIRQLATGGVLVGGLALTYLFVMGGGAEETPNHIPIASSTLEPPVIETPLPGANTPVVVRPDTNTSDAIAEVPAPPDFERSWHPNIDVATDLDREERLRPPTDTLRPPVSTPIDDRDPGQFRGRIGPESSAAAPLNYPRTDQAAYPATYLNRPISNGPGNDAARTARLEGTIIAPAPRRE